MPGCRAAENDPTNPLSALCIGTVVGVSFGASLRSIELSVPPSFCIPNEVTGFQIVRGPIYRPATAADA
jgi:hypothetical protein